MSIEGLDKLYAKLEKLSELDLTKGLTKGAFRVEREAKIIVPVDTGLLRSSIHTEVEDNSATVGTNVEYAANVEFGFGQRPQPYLTPAFHSQKANIKKDLEEDARNQIKRIIR